VPSTTAMAPQSPMTESRDHLAASLGNSE
jgi:hypothetical protein